MEEVHLPGYSFVYISRIGKTGYKGVIFQDATCRKHMCLFSQIRDVIYMYSVRERERQTERYIRDVIYMYSVHNKRERERERERERVKDSMLVHCL